MNCPMRRIATLIVGVCFVIVLGVAGGIAAYYASPRSPVTLKDVHLVNSVVYRGKAIVLDFTLTRSIICDSKVDRWLYKVVEGGKRYWVGLPARANPPTAIGMTVSYQLALPVPPEVASGDWFYFSRSWDECPGPFGLVFRTTRDSGDVPVEIVDPPTTSPMEIITAPGPVTILPGVK